METNAIATELVDLEPVLTALEACDITAVALTDDFEIMNAAIDFDAKRKRKRRRQRPPPPPRRRMGVGDIQQ